MPVSCAKHTKKCASAPKCATCTHVPQRKFVNK